MTVIILLLLGSLVGLISAFFGVGGGVIVIPTLYWLFPQAPIQMVIACSLGVIVVNAIINLIHFSKKDKPPRFKIILLIGIPAATSVLFATNISMNIDQKPLRLIFATVLVALIVKLLISNEASNQNSESMPEKIPFLFIKAPVIGFLGGALAGFTGLGGGAIIVPLLISLLKLPYKWISVHSNGIMLIIAFCGSLNFALMDIHLLDIPFPSTQFGLINLGIIAPICIGALLTSHLGVKLDIGVKPKTKKRLFALLLLSVTLKIFLS